MVAAGSYTGQQQRRSSCVDQHAAGENGVSNQAASGKTKSSLIISKPTPEVNHVKDTLLDANPCKNTDNLTILAQQEEYTLNRQSTLDKRLSACDRSAPIIVITAPSGRGARDVQYIFELQPAYFDLVSGVIVNTDYMKTVPSFSVFGAICKTDLNGTPTGHTFRLHKPNSKKSFCTVNLYPTTCRIMVNGSCATDFITMNLPQINSLIRDGVERMGYSLTELNSIYRSALSSNRCHKSDPHTQTNGKNQAWRAIEINGGPRDDPLVDQAPLPQQQMPQINKCRKSDPYNKTNVRNKAMEVDDGPRAHLPQQIIDTLENDEDFASSLNDNTNSPQNSTLAPSSVVTVLQEQAQTGPPQSRTRLLTPSAPITVLTPTPILIAKPPVAPASNTQIPTASTQGIPSAPLTVLTPTPILIAKPPVAPASNTQIPTASTRGIPEKPKQVRPQARRASNQIPTDYQIEFLQNQNTILQRRNLQLETETKHLKETVALLKAELQQRTYTQAEPSPASPASTPKTNDFTQHFSRLELDLHRMQLKQAETQQKQAEYAYDIMARLAHIVPQQPPTHIIPPPIYPTHAPFPIHSFPPCHVQAQPPRPIYVPHRLPRDAPRCPTEERRSQPPGYSSPDTRSGAVDPAASCHRSAPIPAKTQDGSRSHARPNFEPDGSPSVRPTEPEPKDGQSGANLYDAPAGNPHPSPNFEPNSSPSFGPTEPEPEDGQSGANLYDAPAVNPHCQPRPKPLR